MTAITPIGTTVWDELLPSKAHYPRTTIAANGANLYTVDHSSPPVDIILWRNIWMNWLDHGGCRGVGGVESYEEDVGSKRVSWWRVWEIPKCSG